MSNSNSNFTYTASSSFTSSSSSSNGGTRSYSQTTYSDPSGTKVYRTTQEPGQERKEERIQYNSSGNRIDNGGMGEGRGRIEDVTDQENARADAEKEREREYVERMEAEYAKREGGA
jgi:hypothetical protein